ncbi:unnamed protein product [Microthlaspi erraticum]|uniref:DUF4283 domain-containing protein n=1 Tax=Microthlaspi erraticum TaxID=1685480 RepID=A0A6D2HX84_9BRAS|nr:unnamed protein product [Microthlaspi erraticum]
MTVEIFSLPGTLTEKESSPHTSYHRANNNLPCNTSSPPNDKAARIPYADKGKGIAYQSEPSQWKRIRAPELDTSDLVKENALTLIGRLTNPKEQRLRAMFNFFLDRWELKSSFEGSDLGHDCFQLRFNRVEDLKKVLDNRPYQFGHWMVILQKWEPVISSSFPSQIPFWIRLKGLPLHYWKEELICNIDREAGTLLGHEISKTEAKIHVSINALEPIVKETIVEFASGEEALVTLEYERLGFHCSSCNKLTHNNKDCKLRSTEDQTLNKTNPEPRDRPKSTHREEREDRELRGRRDGSPDYSHRRDRYGRAFGERVYYSNSASEVNRERSTASSFQRRHNTHRDYPERSRHPQNREPEGSNGVGRRDLRPHLQEKHVTNGRSTQSGLQWREKSPSSYTRRETTPELGGNHTYQTPRRERLEPEPNIPAIPTIDEVMEDLREVTV